MADSPRLEQLDYSILQQCMHCGMCLPTCPTYDATLLERNSPRGRIAWMRRIADGELQIDEDFADEMSYCLGCLACQTACPAGVDYAHLIETARSDVVESSVCQRTRLRRFVEWLLMDVLFHKPWRLRVLGRALWLYQASGLQRLIRAVRLPRILPRSLRRLESITPIVRPPFSARRIAGIERPADPKWRVVLLTGCVQDLLYAAVNRATADVLLAHGCEVVTPRRQFCCGSLHAHNGRLAMARQLARANLDTIDLDNVDAVISNAGGCGSHLKHYARLLADDEPYRRRAEQWDSKLKDVHEFLASIGILKSDRSDSPPLRVAYDESCHLRHGQRVATAPIQLLRSLPNIELVPLPEADWCCGSAGIYAVTQPEQALALRDRKVQHIMATGADILATANPGCQLQIETGLRAAGSHIRVVHTMQLAAEVYGRPT